MDKNLPKYVIVESKIREAIERKRIVDKLPGERVLAEEFGFSYMTIRKAINNLVDQGVLYRVATKGTFVGDSSPARTRTGNIAYLLDGRIREGLRSPYYSLVFNELEKVVANQGYSLLYFSNPEEILSQKTLGKVDGIIVSCFPRIEPLIQQAKSLVPIVLIDNSADDLSIPSVTIDNFNAVYDAIDHLCSFGHQRIGFITGLDDSNIGRHRLSGYKNALDDHQLKPESSLVFEGDYTFESGQRGAKALLSLRNPPTAIMCANDTMALGAMRELNRRGMSIPDDISVVGFDDIAVSSQLVPALTTVSAPITKIAENSVKMLLDQIEGREPDMMHIALRGKLAIRQSSGAVIKKAEIA